MAAAGGAKGHGAKHGHDDHDDHGGGDHGDGGHGGGHCPPPWILTFADMVTLLMAFFVLMLMASTTDEPKFQAFAASMRQAFGTLKYSPQGAVQGGTTVLDMNAGPAAGEPTDATDPNAAETGSKDGGPKDGSGGTDGDGQGTAGKGANGKGGPGGAGGTQGAAAGAGQGSGQPGASNAAQVADALRRAAQSGEINVDTEQGPVTVRLPKGAAGADAAQKIAEALAMAAGLTPLDQPTTGGMAARGAGSSGTGAGGSQGADAGLGTVAGQGAGMGQGAGAEGAGGAGAGDGGTGDGGTGDGSAGDGGAGNGGGGTKRSAGFAAAKLALALQQQIGAGNVAVERRDGHVVVTVGEGGAFASGSADMTDAARAIMDKVAAAALGPNTKVTVTGHTDSTPLAGSPYVDNLGLGAARASSVVRELVATGVLPPGQLTAMSKGDTDPIGDNATPEGRAKNRRIEIEIDYGQP